MTRRPCRTRPAAARLGRSRSRGLSRVCACGRTRTHSCRARTHTDHTPPLPTLFRSAGKTSRTNTPAPSLSYGEQAAARPPRGCRARPRAVAYGKHPTNARVRRVLLLRPCGRGALCLAVPLPCRPSPLCTPLAAACPMLLRAPCAARLCLYVRTLGAARALASTTAALPTARAPSVRSR